MGLIKKTKKNQMNKKEVFVHKWQHTVPFIRVHTAYDAVLDEETDVVMDVEIGIDPTHQYGGWYETYDIESGGDRFYAGGVLEISYDGDGKASLDGYDGCFELPDYIVSKLVESGVTDNL